jgi:hypothetical protein
MTTASLSPTAKSSLPDVSDPGAGFDMEFIARFPLDFPALRRLTKWMAFLKALLLMPRNNRYHYEKQRHRSSSRPHNLLRA